MDSSQVHHQIFRSPFPVGNFLDFCHDLSAIFHLLNIGHHIPDSAEAAAPKVGAGIRAEAQVFSTGPVFQIVTGDHTPAAEIGDFILPVAMFFQNFHAAQVHICLGIFVS